MKAAVLYANDDIRYDDYADPVIDCESVIIKVKAAGICGSDIPRVLSNGSHYYPNVLGHEFSGEIVETGKNVKDLCGLQVGDKIAGAPLIPCMKCADCQKGNYSLCRYYDFIGSRRQGAFAEYVKIPAINAIKFDDSVSFEQGAFFEPSTVALHGLRINNYTGGHNAAILGGGTIGLFTMQWLKIFGAKSVTVFDISDERLDLCKKLGADYVINSLNESESLEIYKNAYDFVFETAGNTQTMQSAFEIADNKANICFIGTPSKDLTFTPKLFENMNRKEFRLTGSWMSYSAPFPGEEWRLTAHYFKTGQLKFDDKFIFRRFALNEPREAFDLYKNPGQIKGKIMFII